MILTGYLFGAAMGRCSQASYAAWSAEIRQALTEAVAEVFSMAQLAVGLLQRSRENLHCWEEHMSVVIEEERA